MSSDNTNNSGEGLRAARSIVAASGNNFHSKVVKFLKETEWDVLVSPYFVDPSTDKPREVDLIAEKLYFVSGRWGNETAGYIRVRLHVECKYIAQTTVFWFGQADIKKARAWVAARTPLRENNVLMNEHHHLKNQTDVAKLFASEKTKDVEAEQIFKAVNQCLNGLVINRGTGFQLDRRHLKCLATVEYPVIACSSFEKFYRTKMDDEDVADRIDRNFQLEVNYAYVQKGAQHIREYFLIDIVEFGKLEQFLTALDAEIKAIDQMVRG